MWWVGYDANRPFAIWRHENPANCAAIGYLRYYLLDLVAALP